jgi:hypothetical protein
MRHGTASLLYQLTWQDGIAPNTMRSQCKGGRFHQTLDGSFCWRIMGLLYPTKERRDTGDGDDCASTMLPLLLCHLISHCSSYEERPVEVDLLCLEEQLVWHIQERVEWANAGVGNQDIDPPESLDCFFDYLQGAVFKES